MAAASLAGQAIGFIALMVVSRRIGPDNLGAFSFATSLCRFFAIPVNFGISTLAIREIARRPSDATRIAGQVLALRLGLFLVSYAALVALAPVIASDALVQTLLPICGLFVLGDVVGLAWGLQGLQRFVAVALISLGGQVVYGALVPLLVDGGPHGAVVYAWLNVVGAMAAAVGSWIWFVRKAGWPALPRSLRSLGRLWLSAAPIGLSFVMIFVYYSLDSVMLGYLRSTYEVGQYGVGYRLVAAIIGFAGLWVTVLFPHAARLYKLDPVRLGRQIRSAVTLGTVVALPIGVGGSLVATPLMIGLFGAAFANAGAPFAVLIWSAVVVIVSVNFGNVLMACDGERVFAKGVALGALVNIVLNFALIPFWGAIGAAISTVVTEILVMALMAVALRRRVPVAAPDVRRLGGALAATTIMAGVVIALLQVTNIWVTVAAGGTIYAAVVLMLRVVRPGDLGRLRREGTVNGGAATSSNADHDRE